MYSWIVAQNPVLLEPVGRAMWGNSYTHTSDDNYVYIGTGGAVLIAEVVNRDSLQILNTFYLSSMVMDLAIQQNTLFCLDYLSGLYIYDIENVENPQLISHLDVGKQSIEFIVGDNNIWIANDNEGITRININDIQNPIIVAESDLYSEHLTFYEDYLYVISGNSLDIVILSSSDLNQVGNVEIQNPWMIVFVQPLLFHQQYGYLIEVNAGIQNQRPAWTILTVLDMTDPLNPLRLGTWETSYGVENFTNLNDTLIVASNEHLFFIDATDPENLAEIFTEMHHPPLNLSLSKISYQAPWLFTSHEYMGSFSISEIQDWTDIYSGLILDLDHKPYSIVISDSIAIAGNGEGEGIYLIDISDPVNPVHRFTYESTGGYVRSLEIHNQLLYAATNSGLKIFEIDGAESLILHGQLDFDHTAYCVSVWDNLLAYGGSNYDVHLIDISNPTLPLNISIIDIPSTLIRDIHLKENLLYISGTSGPKIYDISDPVQPIEIWNGGYQFGEVLYPHPEEDIFFVGEGYDVFVFEDSDPNYPELINHITITDSLYSNIKDIFSQGDYLYVTCNLGPQYNTIGFLLVYDISDISNIALIGFANTAGYPWNVHSDGNIIGVADHHDGIYFFETPILPVSGDCDDNYIINISDVILVVDCILTNLECPCGDVDGSGAIDVIDIVLLVDIILNS